MNWREIPQVSAGKKFAFCIATFTLLAFLFPVATPLFASFFLGLAIKEAGITRFVEFLSGPLLYGSTLFLGFTLGALMGVDTLYDPKVGLLLLLGVIALVISGLGGIAGGKSLVARRLAERCLSWRAKNLPEAKITWIDDAL